MTDWLNSSSIDHSNHTAAINTKTQLRGALNQLPWAAAMALAAWLDSISCSALLEQLDDYGVETTEDLLLLDPPDIAALAGSLKKVQAKKFEAALGGLRGGGGGGGGAAAGAAEDARAERAEKLAEGADAEGPPEGGEADAAFAKGAKFLTPSPLRDEPADFKAPEAVPNAYEAAATGPLVQPSLFDDGGKPAPTMQEVGESIYPRIAADERVSDGETAGKITGMILAGFGMDILAPLMTDDGALALKVAEALALLSGAGPVGGQADGAAAAEPAAEPEPEPEPVVEDDAATVMLKRKAAIGRTTFVVRLASGEATTDEGAPLDPESLVESPCFTEAITTFSEIYPGWTGAMNKMPPGSEGGRLYNIEWDCTNIDGGKRVDEGITLLSFRALRSAFLKRETIQPDTPEFGEDLDLLWSTSILLTYYETVGDSRWDRLLGEMMDEAVAEADEAETKWETVTIPENCVGLIIGKNGANVAKLQEKSGAYIELQRDHEKKPDSNVREVYITADSGGPESVETAKNLIKDAIAEERRRQAQKAQQGGRGRGRGGGRGGNRGRGPGGGGGGGGRRGR